MEVLNDVVVSILQKRSLQTVVSGMSIRAVPRVSVVPVMMVQSGCRPVTLRVVSDA